MKIRQKQIVSGAIILLLTLFVSSLAFSTDWPGRKKYPDIPYITTADLGTDLDAGEAIIVDVRSAIEYKVIHAVGALHIPVSKKDFINKVSKLRSENATKKLAFYCNGTTCLKSYVATDKAMKGNIANVSAYDAGIPEWVSTYPGKTLLLGEVVTDPEKQIIPKSEFKKKTISYEDFKAAASTGGVIIDVRDAMQRSGDLPGLGKTLKIPMDAFIQNFVQKKKNQDKSLFIFDQVGKQVRWLEYYLVKNGYTDYTFLKGGATTVLKDQKYKK